MWRRSQIVSGLLILAVVFLSACAPAATPAPAPKTTAPAPAAAPAPVAPVAPARALSWQVEWEKTLEAAKKEGTVAFGTSTGSEVRRALSEDFKNRLGLRVESIVGTVGTITSKILAERRAGLYLWDVLIGGASGQTSVFKPGGGTSPLEPALILPDLTDAEAIKKAWHGGKLPWIDQERHLVAPLRYTSLSIAVNTNLVKPGEINSFDDLLNPKWKGKIMLMDPTQPGTNSDGNLLPMLYEVKGEDWVRKLAAQEPVLIRDDRLAHDWLAQGKYPIYLPPRPETFLEFTKAGAPLAENDTNDVKALTSGASAVSLIGKPPHPNAARIFINFYLSQEGQAITSKALGSPSGRLDVTTEGLPPWSLVKPGRNYWVKDREEVLLKVTDYRTKSKEIFGHLIK